MGAVRDRVAALVEGLTDPSADVAVRLAELIDARDTSPRDVASLSRELRLTLDVLDVDRGADGGDLDELAAKRRARRTDPADQVRA